MSDEIELKPCPFCGRERPRFFKYCDKMTCDPFTTWYKVIMCRGCGGRVETEEKAAVENWNKRVDDIFE